MESAIGRKGICVKPSMGYKGFDCTRERLAVNGVRLGRLRAGGSYIVRRQLAGRLAQVYSHAEKCTLQR